MVAVSGCYPNNISVLFDDNGGTNFHPIEEINHFIIHHANATRRNRPANAPRLGCAVNAILGVANIERAGTQGVFRTASHEGRNNVALLGFPINHDLWRAPIGPNGFSGDFILPGPGETLAANAHRLHNGPVVPQYEIKTALRGAD